MGYLFLYDGSLDPATALPSSFEFYYFWLSYPIIALAGYAAFEYIGRERGRRLQRQGWRQLAVGVATLGCGAWAMHAMGMLALELPIPVAYDLAGTLWSIVPALLGAAAALAAARRANAGATAAVVGGVAMGAGTTAMHLVGVASMHMEATVRHTQSGLIVAVLVAVLLCAASFQVWNLAIRLQGALCRQLGKIAAVSLLSLGVGGMHYWDLHAAYVFRGTVPSASGTELQPALFSALVVIVTGSISLSAVVGIWGERIQTRLNNLALGSKLSLIVVGAAVLAALTTGYTAYSKFSMELQSFAEDKMASLRDGRKAALEIYLRSISRDLAFLAGHDQVRDAVFDFTTAFSQVTARVPGRGAASVLQTRYRQGSPGSTDAASGGAGAAGSSDYDEIHRRYDPWLQNFQRQNRYDDLFLISPEGDLVYSVSKAEDFATNLLDGIWRDTELARIVRIVEDGPTALKQAYTDFEPYAPKAGMTASFIAAPVFNHSGAYIGALALQMPIQRINEIMHDDTGLGESGDTILVGDDLIMRTQSRLAARRSSMPTIVYTPAVQKALEGRSGVEIVESHRTVRVLSAYAPIDFMGTRWALLAEIDVAELLAPARRTAIFVILVTGLTVVIVAVVGFFLSRGLSVPIAEMTRNMRRLASGDVGITVGATERRDEIGVMARALVVFKENIVERQLAEAALRQSQKQLTEKTNMLQAVLRSMNEGIVAFDRRLRLIAWNDEYLRIRSYPKKLAMLGRPFEDFVRFDVARKEFGDGDPQQIVREVVERARASRSHAFERQRPDGTWVEIRGGPIEGGGFVSTYSDITERKRAEQALNDAYDVISSSIHYASRIQRAILPDARLLEETFDEFFVHWEPRDMVGGDIYWFTRWGRGSLVVFGDCTGHGVPGAFMTLIAMGALHRAQAEIQPGQVGRLMQRMHQLMQVTLNQNVESGESDDGMDLAICYLPDDRAQMTYVGAHFSLFIVDGGSVREIKGDRSGVGYRGIPYDQRYSEIRLPLTTTQFFYLTSDGLLDQIGGEKLRAFGKKRFKGLLETINKVPVCSRRQIIVDTLTGYQGEQTRRDDVLVMGFAVGSRASKAAAAADRPLAAVES